MRELLTHIRYEASHPIFQWVRNVNKEASALEGKMRALNVLLEVRHQNSPSERKSLNNCTRLNWNGKRIIVKFALQGRNQMNMT